MPRRKIYWLSILSFCLSFSSLWGQSSKELLVQPLQVTKEVTVNGLDKDFEEISTITITNVSNRDLQLQWDKRIETQPAGWESLVCNKGPNNSIVVQPTPGALVEDRRPFRLRSGESTEFYLVLRPNGKVGKGRIFLPFTSVTQPGSPLATVVFDLKVNMPENDGTATRTDRPKTLRLYPNPAIENFFVEVPSKTTLGKVEVINTLGRRLKTFNRAPGPDGYPIDDLPEGIYLINIYDNQGKKLKTLRLFHRRFGA